MDERSRFEALFYPGTQTLINLHNERDPVKLAALERDITGVAELSARLLKPIKGEFDVPHMQAIHKHLFGEIYPWAGELRDFALFKKRPDGMTTEFARPDEFAEQAGALKHAVAGVRFATEMNTERFATKLAHVYKVLNEFHPFREGNGRTHRIFLNELAKEAGFRLHYDKVAPAAWNYAASMSGQIAIGGGERVPGRIDELQKVFSHIAAPISMEKDNAYTQGRTGVSPMQDRTVLTVHDLSPKGPAPYGTRNRIR